MKRNTNITSHMEADTVNIGLTLEVMFPPHVTNSVMLFSWKLEPQEVPCLCLYIF